MDYDDVEEVRMPDGVYYDQLVGGDDNMENDDEDVEWRRVMAESVETDMDRQMELAMKMSVEVYEEERMMEEIMRMAEREENEKKEKREKRFVCLVPVFSRMAKMDEVNRDIYETLLQFIKAYCDGLLDFMELEMGQMERLKEMVKKMRVDKNAMEDLMTCFV